MEKNTSKKTTQSKTTKAATTKTATPSILEKPKTESEFARRERLRYEHRDNGDDFFASFGFKCIIVFLLILIFQIPMIFIRNLIDDRTTYHREAENSILEPKGGQPEFQGVLIAVPCEKTKITRTTYTLNNELKTKENKDISKYIVFITPEQFDIATSVQPEKLQRGIFEVPVFGCDLKINGSFDKIEEETLKEDAEDITCKALWKESLLLIGISNKKILTTLPEIKIGEKTLTQSLYEPQIGTPFDNTIFYDLGSIAEDGFEFNITANVQGGQILALTPIATENKFNVDSIWKSPSFGGGWLPTTRNITQGGFNAEWNITGLSTKFPKRWSSSDSTTVHTPSFDDYKNGYSKSDGRKYEQSVSVSFYQPVDNYQKATRSTKYSILFLLVPFIALLIFEIFSKVKVHPIQYVLIGLANVVFYLLLLSISEHISFNATYWISCIAVSVLILFYGVSILRKFSSGALFAAINLVSYIFLFGTLQAEDYALLIGSIGIFFVVAALMILTRKIDWYKLKDLYNNKTE